MAVHQVIKRFVSQEPAEGNKAGSPVSSPGRYGPVEYLATARHHQKDRLFRFQFERVEGKWRIYILRMPDLEGRSGDNHILHLYRDGGRREVIYDPQPTSLKDAATISKAWADRILEYIATGDLFEHQKW